MSCFLCPDSDHRPRPHQEEPAAGERERAAAEEGGRPDRREQRAARRQGQPGGRVPPTQGSRRRADRAQRQPPEGEQEPLRYLAKCTYITHSA